MFSFNLNFTDCFIAKLDADGDFIWQKSIGGANSDAVANLVLPASNDGGIYDIALYQSDRQLLFGNYIADLDIGVGGFSNDIDIEYFDHFTSEAQEYSPFYHRQPWRYNQY